MTAKKKAEKKAESQTEVDAVEAAPLSPLSHPVDRSIMMSVTTTELNPAYAIDVD